MSGPGKVALVCEWDPENNRATQIPGSTPHGPPVVVVGARGEWHLCAKCAALPAFKRYRRRRWFQRVDPWRPS